MALFKSVIYSLSEQYKNADNNPLLNKHLIPTRFYEAIFNSGYLSAIDPKLFLEITVYYNTIDSNFNDLLNLYYSDLTKLRNDWSSCVLTSVEPNACDEKRQMVDNAYEVLSPEIISVWTNAAHWIIEHKIDERFNPTKDRLNSPILRLLMGSSALPFLEQ